MEFDNKLSKIDQIKALKPASSKSDLAKQEKQAYSAQTTPDVETLNEIKLATAQIQLKLRQAQVDREHAHNDGIKQDQLLRDKYAAKAYRFVWGWSSVLFIILFLSGSKSILGFEFELSENVLLALITGVTVNILAVFLSVINNLFPIKPSIATRLRKNAQAKAKNKST